jgi:hypothetical protein
LWLLIGLLPLLRMQSLTVEVPRSGGTTLLLAA